MISLRILKGTNYTRLWIPPEYSQIGLTIFDTPDDSSYEKCINCRLICLYIILLEIFSRTKYLDGMIYQICLLSLPIPLGFIVPSLRIIIFRLWIWIDIRYKYILYNGNFWITAENIALTLEQFQPQQSGGLHWHLFTSSQLIHCFHF